MPSRRRPHRDGASTQPAGCVIHSARMPEYAHDPRRRAGPVARITLNRPDKRNPIGPATCGELVARARARSRRTPTVRVVVLTGAGTVFSAGGDLSAMHSRPPGGPTGEPRRAVHGDARARQADHRDGQRPGARRRARPDGRVRPRGRRRHREVRHHRDRGRAVADDDHRRDHAQRRPQEDARDDADRAQARRGRGARVRARQPGRARRRARGRDR